MLFWIVTIFGLLICCGLFLVRYFTEEDPKEKKRWVCAIILYLIFIAFIAWEVVTYETPTASRNDIKDSMEKAMEEMQNARENLTESQKKLKKVLRIENNFETDMSVADQTDREEKFFLAVIVGKIDKVEGMLQTTPALVTTPGSDGDTALHSAVLAGTTEREAVSMVKLLLEHDVPINSKDVDGRTALHHAVSVGKLDVSSVLLQAGADVDATDKYGQTPLMGAAKNGFTKVASLLLEHGANPNARSTTGATPLHQAAFMGHLGVCELLVKNGADPRLQVEGMTAPQIAKDRGYGMTAGFMKNAAARRRKSNK